MYCENMASQKGGWEGGGGKAKPSGIAVLNHRRPYCSIFLNSQPQRCRDWKVGGDSSDKVTLFKNSKGAKIAEMYDFMLFRFIYVCALFLCINLCGKTIF